MARNMSQSEINRRKKAQAHISQTTGTLGLAGLGAFAASKIPGTKLAATKAVPGLRKLKVTPKKLENTSLGLSSAAGGIGGAGSYNFAAYSAAESRQKKKAVGVKKNDPFGIEKAGEWKTIGQREQTQRRDRKVMRAAGGAAAVGGGLVALGVKRNPRALKITERVGHATRASYRRGQELGNSKPQSVKRAVKATGRNLKANPSAAYVASGGATVAGAAATGGAAKGQHTYQQHKINQRRRDNASKVSKGENVSAFGITH